MKLLLDQGLPRSTAAMFRAAGVDAIHTGEVELATAFDAAILERAEAEGRVVITLDADFHTLMALSGARLRYPVDLIVSIGCAEAAAWHA